MSKGPWRPLEERQAEKREREYRAEQRILKRAEREARRITREAKRARREKAKLECAEIASGLEGGFKPRIGCLYCSGGSEDTIPIEGLNGPSVGFVCLDCKAMFI